jgi:hypothetical protein
VQTAENKRKLSELERRLSVAANWPDVPKEELKVGACWIADWLSKVHRKRKYRNDKYVRIVPDSIFVLRKSDRWYRVKILEVDVLIIRVLLIDFGQEDSIVDEGR